MMSRLILLIISVFLVGCQSSTQLESSDDLKLANTALLNGHATNALQIYKQRLDVTPNDPELLFLAGTACNQSGRYDEALHYLNKGNELAPSGQFEREIGRARLALGDFSLAQVALSSAVDGDATDDVALNSLGVAHSLQQNFTLARDAFNQALALKPDSTEYRNNLALTWMLDGQPEQSIRILYPIYQRGEASSKLRLNLALSYAMAGKVDAAKQVAAQDLSQAELENNGQYYELLASQLEGSQR